MIRTLNDDKTYNTNTDMSNDEDTTFCDTDAICRPLEDKFERNKRVALTTNLDSKEIKTDDIEESKPIRETPVADVEDGLEDDIYSRGLKGLRLCNERHPSGFLSSGSACKYTREDDFDPWVYVLILLPSPSPLLAYFTEYRAINMYIPVK